ncbi:hypothetical protein [Latilactobacillus curvatus]|nr:hypothetical protein [Latilactobacillus curvatus]
MKPSLTISFPVSLALVVVAAAIQVPLSWSRATGLAVVLAVAF